MNTTQEYIPLKQLENYVNVMNVPLNNIQFKYLI